MSLYMFHMIRVYISHYLKRYIYMNTLVKVLVPNLVKVVEFRKKVGGASPLTIKRQSKNFN